MLMKSSNDTIGNRSRDLPVCSAVPEPLRHQQRVPQTQVHTININSRTSNWQRSLLSKKNSIIRIFCLFGSLAVAIDSDTWSSFCTFGLSMMLQSSSNTDGWINLQNFVPTKMRYHTRTLSFSLRQRLHRPVTSWPKPWRFGYVS
jgi:hypothetical protein